MRKEPLDPKTRKRNIILGVILAIVILFIAIFTAQSIYKSDFADEGQEEDKQIETGY
jgi:predicted tellurium resistance membrane protein TerC